MPNTLRSALLCALAALAPGVRAQEADPAIQTVTVTATRAPVVKKLDKTVVDVANAPRAANGSAQDVLQSTPELSVTADGNIAVRGNPKVTVLIDGKPSAMLSGSNEERALALQTMSGADIAAIEVVTNPSAAYHADGGAIVNIVLKRDRKPGAHAQLQGAASNGGLWNLGASGDATRGGLSVHGKLALRHDGNRKLRGSEVDWRAPAGAGNEAAGQTLQASDVFVHRVVTSASLGIDEALSEHDTLGLALRYNGRRSHPLFDVLNSERSDGGADTRYHRISDGPNRQDDDGASLNFTHQDRGTAFKATLQRSSTDALVDKSYADVFIEPALATGYSLGATRSARRLTQGTLDWSRALASGQIGAGLDIQDQADAIDNVQATVDPLTRRETLDPLTTNGYAVKTLLSAVYLTDQIRSGKWEALLGARFDHMALRVAGERDGPGTPARHWQALDPSLHLRYDLSDRTGLTLAYRRSLQRPDPRDLDPFTTYVDAHNLGRGNPGLQPQRMSAWELGMEADAGRLSSHLGAFYRATRDTVFDARSITGDVIVTSKQNGGQARSIGLTGSLDWTVDPALRLGLDGGAYQAMLQTPDLADIVRQAGLAGYLNLRASYSAGSDDLSLDAHGQSSSITPLGRAGATSSVNLGWKHKLSSTLSLTVNADDIFDGSRRSYRTDTSTFRQSGFEHVVARRIVVGLVKKID